MLLDLRPGGVIQLSLCLSASPVSYVELILTSDALRLEHLLNLAPLHKVLLPVSSRRINAELTPDTKRRCMPIRTSAVSFGQSDAQLRTERHRLEELAPRRAVDDIVSCRSAKHDDFGSWRRTEMLPSEELSCQLTTSSQGAHLVQRLGRREEARDGVPGLLERRVQALGAFLRV